MLVAVVFCSCGEVRYSSVALGWNAMVVGIACVGLT